MQAYGVDNYLWKQLTCGVNNPANCDDTAHNCTDFAMQRIRYTLGLPCLLLGNAKEWAIKAAALGYAVNATPALGSILQLGPGVNGASADGHVGFVLGVGPGSFFGVSARAGEVVAEQYNWLPCAWSIRVFPVAGGTRFIHFADLSGGGPAPPPPNPIMRFVTSPLGALSLLGGVALIAWSQSRKHAGEGGAFEPVGEHVEHLVRGTVRSGFTRRRAARAHQETERIREQRWQDAYQNAAERLYPGKAALSWEEDDAVVKEANAEVASE